MSAVHSHSPTPVISVLLPVYNAELYLRQAVESVLAQTFSNFELLVIDDGSTDGSLTILRDYEALDSRVQVLSWENHGLVATLNELIGKAQGRYLARMDADDICLPERFEKQVAFLKTSPDHVAVGSWVEQMNAMGQPIGICRHPLSHEEIDQKQLTGRTSLCHPTVMIRTAGLPGLYDPLYETAEDLDLFLRIAETGKLANIPEVLLRYRVHNDSICTSNNEMQLLKMRLASERAWARRGIKSEILLPEYSRPRENKDSQHEFALKYGWVSWRHGHRKTWWTYAREALLLRPFAPSSWNLLVFGFLKAPPLEQVTDN